MARSGVGVGQGVGTGVRERVQRTVFLGHPPGGPWLLQPGAEDLGGEVLVEVRGQIRGRVGDAEPGHERVDEGLAPERAEGLGVGVGGGADPGVGHGASRLIGAGRRGAGRGTGR